MIALLIILSLLLSCSPNEQQLLPYQPIQGRDLSISPIYRIRVPEGWTRIDPTSNTYTTDTTLPICTFKVDDIRITLHNFPDMRIPPSAQVTRWKQQIHEEQTIPQAWAGFTGLLFIGEESDKMTLGWAMELGSQHAKTLQGVGERAERQMRSDWTIKATGPTDQMLHHREQIIEFAQSFELIEEIPQRS